MKNGSMMNAYSKDLRVKVLCKELGRVRPFSE